MFFDIVSNQLKGLLNVLGIEFFLLLPPIPLYHKRRKRPFNLMVVADGTADHAGGYLLLTGSTVFKPALELMSVRTEEIKSNHLFDSLAKILNARFPSFLRRQESSFSRTLWIPVFTGMTTSYELFLTPGTV
jgi:hypothetical protein